MTFLDFIRAQFPDLAKWLRLVPDQQAREINAAAEQWHKAMVQQEKVDPFSIPPISQPDGHTE